MDAADASEPHVLVIDEINRGNIAKVFGELYFLLEYRSEPIDLLYGSQPFEMPDDLYIIGTMNTADRSIALLDTALRRRFHFVGLFPDADPIKGLLKRWLKRNAPQMVGVANLVEAANAKLPDRHLRIGPSHFMVPSLNWPKVERIWRRSILPYIEEQFFDEPDRVSEFELDKLSSSSETSAEPAGLVTSETGDGGGRSPVGPDGAENEDAAPEGMGVDPS